MISYRRRLPHRHPLGQPLFLTWRLHGSLPPHRAFPPSNSTSGKAFVALDRLLDQSRTGPLYLSRPDIAQLVIDALHYGQDSLRHFTLHAFVVMPNHVHAVLTPEVPVPKLGSLKGITAKRANQILGLTGRPFWQEESYDHLVRDGKEMDRICAYIEENRGQGWLPRPVNIAGRVHGAREPARGPAAAQGGRPTRAILLT